MALLWFLYSLAVLFTFQEPNRSGLEELKRREEEMRMAESEGMSPRLDSFRDDDDDDDISSADTSTCEEQHDTDKPVSRNSPLYCIKYMTRATALCMSLIFMKRVALEVRVVVYHVEDYFGQQCHYMLNELFSFHLPLIHSFRSFFPHFSLAKDYCCINFGHYQKSIRMVDSKCGDFTPGKRLDCDTNLNLCWMVVPIL